MTVPQQVKRMADEPALIVTPHPVSLQGQRRLSAAAAEFTPGESLARLLERQGVVTGQQWVVTIDGLVVPEPMWSHTRPKQGYLIECRRVPQKDILRVIAIAALSYFTFGAGGASIFGTTLGGKVLAGIAFMAGSLVINKLLAPKMPTRPDQQVSPSYSLTAARNRLRPFEPMGLVLGEPYAVPDMGAQPYTYFSGGEQYLWQIFHLGINCAEVSNLRVGQTALHLYKGVNILRNGLASGNSAFPALGTSVDTVAGALLEAPEGVATWVTRTSSAGTVRLALDMLAQLFSTHPDGFFEGRILDVEIQYREVGSPTWLPFTEYIPAVPPVYLEQERPFGKDSEITYSWKLVITPGVPEVPAGITRLWNASQKPLRVTIERAVPPGQYEVRARKGHEDYVGTAGSNQLEWSQLRSYQEDTGNYDSQARLAIQIQASGQLNGALDELNAVLRATPMPFWNGASWVTASDRASGLCNPGALILMLARGLFASDGRRLAGLGYSDEQIDIEGLKRFMVHCALHGFEFSYFLQESMGLQELLDAIAYAGMGELAFPDGRIGVVFFSEDDPVEGVINMANIKARSFSVDYDTMPTADEIEFQYFDRERGHTWKSLRVTAPGVTVPRTTARQPLMGVTTEAHAATLARFSMAQNIYQRKTVGIELDLEYMTYRRGAVVALSHDLTQWGYSGRLVACADVAGSIHLTLDEPVPADNPAGGASTRYIGLRLPGEQQMRVFPVQAFAGETRQLVLGAAWPAGVDLPGASSGDPAHDTLWVYDFKAVPGQRLRVAEVLPSVNGARLSLVPETAEFWQYTFTGDYSPPPSGSLLRPAPSVLNVVVTEQLARQGNTYYTDLAISLDIDGPFQRAELWGGVADGDYAPPLQKLAEGQSQSLQWRGGLDERWHLEVRVFSESRQSAPYRLMYDVQGLRAPPPDVTDLAVNGNTVSWTPVEVPDLAGYEMRFQFGTSTWWDTAVPLHTGLITESPYQLTRRPQGDVTLLMKAVDTTGNRSVNAAAVTTGFAPIPVSNVAAALPQHPDFLGDITGGTVFGGDLLANDTDSFYEPADGPMYLPPADPMYGASQYSEMVYEFTVFSAESGTLLLLYTISAESLLIEYRARGGEPMYEPAADELYEPAAESVYGDFPPWSVWPGSFDFNGTVEVEFRLTLAGGLVQGVIYDLSAVIDAPEVSEVLDDVPILAAGTRLALTNTYRAIKNVSLTVQADGGAGVSARLKDKDPVLGPLVEVLNNAGTPVDGVVDAVIRGY